MFSVMTKRRACVPCSWLDRRRSRGIDPYRFRAHQGQRLEAQDNTGRSHMSLKSCEVSSSSAWTFFFQ